jgi:hypothetical protein
MRWFWGGPLPADEKPALINQNLRNLELQVHRLALSKNVAGVQPTTQPIEPR